MSHDLDLSKSRDVTDHVTNRFATGNFLLVIRWYRGSISNLFEDICINVSGLLRFLIVLKSLSYGDGPMCYCRKWDWLLPCAQCLCSVVKVEILRWGNCTCTLGPPVSSCGPLVDSFAPPNFYVCILCSEIRNSLNCGRKKINPVMNYFTEIATWIL